MCFALCQVGTFCDFFPSDIPVVNCSIVVAEVSLGHKMWSK